jgi:hypothetical protein
MAGLLQHQDAGQRTLLIADDVPLTRRAICEAAVASPFFQGEYGMPAFKPPTEGAPSMGKVYDTALSRKALGGWTPKFPSFAAFMAEQPAPSAAVAAAGAGAGAVDKSNASTTSSSAAAR